MIMIYSSAEVTDFFVLYNFQELNGKLSIHYLLQRKSIFDLLNSYYYLGNGVDWINLSDIGYINK